MTGAVRVSAGILLSRIVGLLRERVVAFYFGVGPYADVIATSFRGPNVIQNLLGEQALSAAFIPIYSRKLAEGKVEEAGRFAGAIFGLLLAAAAFLTLCGVLLARPIVTVLALGYVADAAAIEAGEATVDRFELSVVAVRILFPMAGVLVLASWCLGVLNSHRRFFLSYVAPVLWSSAIISALLWVGGSHPLDQGDLTAGQRLLYAACVGALIGGLLQFALQLPLVARVMRGFRLSFSHRVTGVRDALRNFAPAIAGRGVVQLSQYVDLYLASFLAVGATGALSWGQRLAVLPLGLFGTAFAAAELPELSRASGEPSVLVTRLDRALRQTLFLTAPSALGFLIFGFVLVGALYRTGRFALLDNWLVYLVLCGYTLGLLPSVASRLLQTPFYATNDTRTPARIAALRVAASAALGLTLSLWWDRYSVSQTLGLDGGSKDLYLGALGLATAAGLASWVELVALHRALKSRLAFTLPWKRVAGFVGLALVASVPSVGLWFLLRGLHPIAVAAAVVGSYALIYLGLARLLGLAEATAMLDRLLGRKARGA